MEERTKFHVGLDVHKDSISIGAAELGRAPAWLIGKVPHDLNKLLKGAGQDRHGRATAYRVRGWPDRFGLQRALKERGSSARSLHHRRSRGVRATESRPTG